MRMRTDTEDLIVTFRPDDSKITYHNVTNKTEFRIEYPLLHVLKIYSPGSMTEDIAIELTQAPRFFVNSDGTGFFESKDFTENREATRCLTHHLAFDPDTQSRQFRDLVSAALTSGHHKTPESPSTPGSTAADASLEPSKSGVEMPAMEQTSLPENTGTNEPTVLWLAASLLEFNLSTTKYEAGYPYLTYAAGEVSTVVQQTMKVTLANFCVGL